MMCAIMNFMVRTKCRRATTGGHPKIATVISADVPELGRLPIGSKIRFEPVTIEVAQALRREMLAYLDGLRDRIVPIDRTSDNAGPLLDQNLISGVVDALLDNLADH
jgi:5-oxoprolinase (ATP-hydrolysing) subunit C